MLSVAFDDLSFSPERMPSPTPPSLQQVLIILESIILYPVRDPSVAEAPPKGWSYDVCYSPPPFVLNFALQHQPSFFFFFTLSNPKSAAFYNLLPNMWPRVAFSHTED